VTSTQEVISCGHNIQLSLLTHLYYEVQAVT